MASSSSLLHVSVGVQTEDVQENAIADKVSCIGTGSSCSDSGSESEASFYGLKQLFNDNGDSSDSESICPRSLYSSCSSTRRNSFESDLEESLQSLFTSRVSSSSASSVSSRSHVDSPLAPSNSSNIFNGLDVLMRRITCERFLELRRIQLGDRPVTAGNARNNLESFFHRAIHGPTEEERQQIELANRPDHVLNDFNTLQQSALVQGALQNSFRQQLEATLSSRLPSSPIQNSVTQQRSAQSNHGRPQQQHPTQRQQQPTATQQRHTVGGSHFRSQLERMFSDRASVVSSIPNRNVTRQQRPHISTNVPVAPPVYQVPQQQQITETQRSPTSNLHITIETGLQLLTESIAEDLTRLQSLQVVSNMLGTEFRNELEDMVQARVETIGNDEDIQNVEESRQQNIRIPRSRQNVRPTATTNRPTRGNMASMNANREEMNSLRRQMEEMKRMMAISMEIQADTQRAIRQEVSAIFSTFMQVHLLPRVAESQQQSTTGQPTAFQPIRSAPVASGQCVICSDRNVDTLLYQCGHMCTCHQCGLQLKMDGHNCPMCRAPIRDVVRAYQTQQH